jgi:sugar phosphate isomerase/epimerase
MEIGAQFYTLRDKCTCTKDFSETLARVADIGFKEVQISGVCKYEPEWLRDELKKNGLKCVLTHWGAEDLRDNTLEVINKHKIFGCDNIGIGVMPGWVSWENYLAFARDFKEPARLIKENGAKFFYHNHAFEFSRCPDGEYYFDKILKVYSPDELQITLDTYWAALAGMELSDLIPRLNGRLECVHLKDLAVVDNAPSMAVVGEGNINFEKLLPLFEKAGTKHLLIEQDDTHGECPFDCLKRSYKNLKAMGL